MRITSPQGQYSSVYLDFRNDNIYSPHHHPSPTPYFGCRFNSDQRFGVHHYAGEVYYEIDGFTEKNRDGTNNDMKELMTSSSNEVLKTMAEESIKMDAALNAANNVASANSAQVFIQ